MSLLTPTQITSFAPNNMPSQGVVFPELGTSFVSTDAINGNQFIATGNDLLLLFNSDTNPQTVTFYSAPDVSGRFADVVDYPLQAGTFIDVRFIAASLFTQTTGMIQFKTSSDLVRALPFSL